MVGIQTLFFCILAVSVSCIEGDVNVTVKPEERIVGGEDASSNEFPHHVYLVRNRQLGNEAGICGGSLLSTEWVLTAAHCVHKAAPELNEMAAGRHRGPEIGKSDSDLGEQLSRAKEVFLHPCYLGGALDPLLSDDIALIKLDTPFTLNDKVKTIRIDETDRAKPDTQTTTIGWGLSDPNGVSKFPRVLKKATTQLPGVGHCKGIGIDSQSQQCSDDDFIRGGDLGGSLLCQDGGVNYVCGISSATKGQIGTGSRPTSVFTRVYHFRNWIKKVMATGCNNDLDCVEPLPFEGLDRPPRIVESCPPNANNNNNSAFSGKDANNTDSRATTLYGEVLYELFVPMILISFLRIYETNIY